MDSKEVIAKLKEIDVEGRVSSIDMSSPKEIFRRDIWQIVETLRSSIRKADELALLSKQTKYKEAFRKNPKSFSKALSKIATSLKKNLDKLMSLKKDM